MFFHQNAYLEAYAEERFLQLFLTQQLDLKKEFAVNFSIPIDKVYCRKINCTWIIFMEV